MSNVIDVKRDIRKDVLRCNLSGHYTVVTQTAGARDWAAMLASRLEVGQKLDFTVYDPATGVSKVAGEIGKAEQIRVPAGTFETIRAVYRIEKLKETETYEVLASKETPGFMVREDFSNGMSTELVKAVFH